jgi:hypothetical protein
VSRTNGITEWPSIPKRLFLDFLDAIENARAEDEHRRVAEISQAAKGGAVLYERIEERILKDGTRVVTTERRFQPPDWYADAWMLKRRAPDRWGRKVRFEPPPPGAPPAKTADLSRILPLVWANNDPRSRRPPGVEPQESGASSCDQRINPGGVAGDSWRSARRYGTTL